MHFKAMQEAPGPSVVVWIDLELGPDSALVIGCVARAQVAIVACLVLRMVRCQRPQAYRRKQTLLYDLEHRLPACWCEDGMAQGDSQGLIGPDGAP